MTDRDDKVERWLRQGVSKVEIARRLGVNRSTVARIAARVGFPAQRRGDDGHDWAAIRAHYAEGHSAAGCRRHFGIKESTWDAAIHRAEIVPRVQPAQDPPGSRRLEVASLVEDGLNVTEIARRLGVSPPTVCFHMRKLGIPPDARYARRHDWEAIAETYESGVSMRECKRVFGFSSDAWAEAVKRGAIVPRPRVIPIEELLVAGRGATSRAHLKARLVDAGLKANRCERCGIEEWRESPLSLQLHHINGDGCDNRLENLEFLCPNCHSQTENWGGRNKRRRSKLRLVKPLPDEDQEAEVG